VDFIYEGVFQIGGGIIEKSKEFSYGVKKAERQWRIKSKEGSRLGEQGGGSGGGKKE